jgi:hypothetical protein
MALTYPLTYPSEPGFTALRFGIRRRAAVTESPFTGDEHVYENDYAKWFAEVSLPPMKRDKAAAWCAFLVGLRGRKGTFYLGDVDAGSLRGAGFSGNATLSSNASLGADSVSFSRTGSDGVVVFKAGDYFSLGTGTSKELHMVVEDAAISSNVVTAKIEPPLLAAHSSGALADVTNPEAVFRLDSNDMASWDTDHVSKFGLSFTATEAR